MALRNTSGTKAVPRLVVKIIGSKQVKYFITEELDKENGAAIPLEVVMKEPPDKQDSIVARSHRQAEAERGVGSALQAAINKAPKRLCVTAPSGDRSLSYIHQKNPAVIRTELRARTAARASDEEEKPTYSQRDLAEEEQEDRLSLALIEQLADWQASSPLRTIQEEVVTLDPALKGTISQSQITQAFLRHEVPLKLPTFRQLLLTFSDADHPDQVHYKDLLQFLSGVVLPAELQDDVKAESGHVSHTSGVPRGCTEPPPASVDHMETETETWLQRFQSMERSMHMCDSQNTGYIDQDKARRLIQNYNHIFTLKLSPLRISEVTHGHGGRRQGKVHLDTALQYLKKLG